MRKSVPVPLIDPFARTVKDLRISITDRCNFRCTYCMPSEGMQWLPREDLLSFELLARPALRRLAGHAGPAHPTVLAVADGGLGRRPDGKTHWVRVFGGFGADGRLHVWVTGPQGSHQLAATAGAQGLAQVVDGDGVAPGGDVPVLWFPSY